MSVLAKLQTITKTLRGKLALWYLGSVALIIAIFLFATSFLFWVTLQKQIDHHVHITVNEASEIVQNYTNSERDELLKNLVSTQGMTIIVLSPDGAPVLETNSTDVALVTEHQLQKILSLSKSYGSAPVHFTASKIRFAAMPVQISAGKGILAVGYSTQVLQATFNRMLLIVAGILMLLVLPTAFIGYQLLKKQLLPLERIAKQAESIHDTTSLSKRINIRAKTTELQTIQNVINEMLSKLEKVFSSERQFFSDAAHTLKTPLAVLRSQIETSALSQKKKQSLLNTVDMSNETVQDLLFLSKLGTTQTKTQRFSLSKLLQNLSELASTLGEHKHLQVSSDIQSEVFFKADQKLLQRALANIIHNAVLYNKTKGELKISLKKQKQKILITVSDTGIGIAKAEQAKLFTRFFRGSNAKGSGSGLGLNMSKTIIESLGGNIKFDSKLNKGSRVAITLPFQQD